MVSGLVRIQDMLVAIIDSALRDSNSLTSRYKAQALMRFLKKEGHPKLILIGWREIELVFLHQHPLHQHLMYGNSCD